MRDHKLYLDDIIECILNIELFIKDVEYESFVICNEKLFAVKHALMIIGEAANKLPENINLYTLKFSGKILLG